MSKKQRITIPPEIADEVLFLSNRTCCICRENNKPIQIHHIDEDPSNNKIENLAVLCTICHDFTQVKGGFGRKLNAGQDKLYRDEWQKIVKDKNSVNSTNKGGDGGQIFIFTKKLSGDGKMSVDGGEGPVGGNAGKIRIQTENSNYTGEMSAKGGKSTK